VSQTFLLQTIKYITACNVKLIKDLNLLSLVSQCLKLLLLQKQRASSLNDTISLTTLYTWLQAQSQDKSVTEKIGKIASKKELAKLVDVSSIAVLEEHLAYMATKRVDGLHTSQRGDRGEHRCDNGEEGSDRNRDEEENVNDSDFEDSEIKSEVDKEEKDREEGKEEVKLESALEVD
jgi:hypothetical protein